ERLEEVGSAHLRHGGISSFLQFLACGPVSLRRLSPACRAWRLSWPRRFLRQRPLPYPLRSLLRCPRLGPHLSLFLGPCLGPCLGTHLGPRRWRAWRAAPRRAGPSAP